MLRNVPNSSAPSVSPIAFATSSGSSIPVLEWVICLWLRQCVWNVRTRSGERTRITWLYKYQVRQSDWISPQLPWFYHIFQLYLSEYLSEKYQGWGDCSGTWHFDQWNLWHWKDFMWPDAMRCACGYTWALEQPQTPPSTFGTSLLCEL